MKYTDENGKNRIRMSLTVKTVIITVVMVLAVSLCIFQVCYVANKRLDIYQQENVLMYLVNIEEGSIDPVLVRSVLEGKSTPEEQKELELSLESIRQEIGFFQDATRVALVRLKDGERKEVAATDGEEPDISRRELGKLMKEIGKGLTLATRCAGFLPDGKEMKVEYIGIMNEDWSDILGYLEICVPRHNVVLYDYFPWDLNDLNFLNLSLRTILIIVPIVIFATLLFLWIHTLRPVRRITKGVMDFSKGNKRSTREDVMNVSIRSGDEMEILCGEIRSMQNRIIDVTDEVERVTAEREHLKGQLEMAVRLKLVLVPTVYPAFPEIPSIDIYADILPTERIGGDFYDHFQIDSDHIALVIADVFDGGTVSALFMVAFKLLIRHFADLGFSPGDVMTAVNNRLFRDNEDDLTLSAWYGVYEISTGKVTAVNAGHESPILVKEDSAAMIEEDVVDWIVGMMGGIDYGEYSFTIRPGEMLFLYTDGVSEAKNAEEELFGTDRIEELLVGIHDPEEAIVKMQEAVKTFTKNAPPDGDATTLCLLRRREDPDK